MQPAVVRCVAPLWERVDGACRSTGGRPAMGTARPSRCIADRQRCKDWVERCWRLMRRVVGRRRRLGWKRTSTGSTWPGCGGWRWWWQRFHYCPKLWWWQRFQYCPKLVLQVIQLPLHGIHSGINSGSMALGNIMEGHGLVTWQSSRENLSADEHIDRCS